MSVVYAWEYEAHDQDVRGKAEFQTDIYVHTEENTCGHIYIRM